MDVMYKAMPFCHQSSFTKTSTLRERPFNPEYRVFADTVFFRTLNADGGTFRRVPRYISIYDKYGMSSTMTRKRYLELCRAFERKPSFKEYFTLQFKNLIKGIKYSKLRFKIDSRRKPWKYILNREDVKQLTEKF